MATNPDSLSFSRKLGGAKTRTSASQVLVQGLAFIRETSLFFSFLFFKLSLPPHFFICMCLSLPDYQHQLRATTASLVLLRLDVVVYLELGLIWLLRRSVLQLPDRERERCRKLDAEVADVWDGAQTG